LRIGTRCQERETPGGRLSVRRTTVKRVIVLLAVAALFVGLLAGPAGAGRPLSGEASTVDGYATWDSDMINIEAVDETGAGVYVAVLDTGLAPNWRDYFPEERVATELGKGFVQPVSFKAKKDECGVGVEVGRLRETTWVGSRGTTHGTHVASTILGYYYRSNSDLFGGFPLWPIMVRGIAPDVTIIPVKVLADYQVPALPKCEEPTPSQTVVFGTSEMVAAGIDYVTDLAMAGYEPMVINMSLGGGPGEPLAEVEKTAIDRAIANGVIVVASAGNEGDLGMGYPGAYPPVISVGSSGWTKEWEDPTGLFPLPWYRMWWLQADFTSIIEYFGYTDVSEDASEVYVSDFSSRELTSEGQDLDVLAPGSWVRGPYPGFPGYSHLPWWSAGIGDIAGWNPGNFYYVGGTSMASPHVAAVASMMLEKNSSLMQADIESILESTALPIGPGSASVIDLDATIAAFINEEPSPVLYTPTWGTDATGAGLVQADAAIAAIP
jgi:subtilisin family serine protease